jgi:hypothetical protein
VLHVAEQLKLHINNNKLTLGILVAAVLPTLQRTIIRVRDVSSLNFHVCHFINSFLQYKLVSDFFVNLNFAMLPVLFRVCWYTKVMCLLIP